MPRTGSAMPGEYRRTRGGGRGARRAGRDRRTPHHERGAAPSPPRRSLTSGCVDLLQHVPTLVVISWPQRAAMDRSPHLQGGPFMKEPIFVTGATGTVGGYLVDELLKRG